MVLTIEDRLRTPGDVVYRNVGGETVLLNLKSGTYFGLNRVGSRMLDLIVEHGCLRAVAEAMQTQYEVDPSDLERDLIELAQALLDNGLLEKA